MKSTTVLFVLCVCCRGIYSNPGNLEYRDDGYWSSISADKKSGSDFHIPEQNGIVKRSVATSSGHGNSSHGNGSELLSNRSHGNSGHDGIHVVSWNFEYVKSPFIISVFVLAAGIAKLGFHHANFLSSKVPESCLLIILGTIVGAILDSTLPEDVSKKLGMSAELFFLYLLPPIILESAYSLHDRTFYENVGTVLIYAVIGTILNCFLIGPTLYGLYKGGALGAGMAPFNLTQILVFSAIIVAVDPVAVLAIFQEVGVNNTLYFLVFGESLLNDAVTVVLYNTMKTLNLVDHITVDQIFLGIVQFFVVSLGGLSMGVIFGLITAIITKFTEHCRVVEPLAVFILAYLSYLGAEMFHFSGIISIIGCGLTQAQYAFHNISRKSYTTVKYFSKMQSSTCDCIIFMFLGVALFKKDILNPSNWHVGFILWTLLLCLLCRFLVVFGLTRFLNKNNRLRKIDIEEQFIMAYGGLRGAVAFSLVDVLNPNNLPKGHFLTTTIMVIFFTVFVQGITIKPLVKFLRVKMEEKQQKLISEEINTHVTDHVMAGIEEILGKRGEHYIRELFEHYNTRYLKIWLQRDPISTDEQIMQHFEKLALQQHFENLAGSKMIQEKYCSDQAFVENISIDDNEEPESDEDTESVTLMLPIPSINASSEDVTSNVSNEFDVELIRENVDRRRKSLFPVNLSKNLESRLVANPTAEDVRKIMVPTRRQMQFKRLDKNLKSEDSENDLIRYLKDKQYRTRRMSRAVLGIPATISESPDPNLAARRKSLAPAAISNNYRRRLSLAVPDMAGGQARRRMVSDGNVLKGIDSPGRRRLQFRRSKTLSDESSEKDVESPKLAEKKLNPKFSLSPPPSPRRNVDTPASLDIITEHSDEGYSGAESQSDGDTSLRSRLKKPDNRVPHPSDSDTGDSRMALSSNSSPNSGELETVDLNETETNIPERSKPLISPKSSLKKGTTFFPAKRSPSAVRRSHFQKSKTISDEVSPTKKLYDKTSGDDRGKIRHNPSYVKALSFDDYMYQDT